MTRLLQTETNTTFDRYPAVFNAAASRLENRGNILSFGCSRGDELFTLAEQYFNDSTIVGVDRNQECLEIARSRMPDFNIRNNKILIELSDEIWLKSLPRFDCIFAMSVLCLWPHTKEMDDISGTFPYEKFESAVSLLCNLLKPNGLFVIVNSNYSFEDAGAFDFFKVEPATEGLNSGFVKRFLPSGLVDKRTNHGVIFRKLDNFRRAEEDSRL